MPSESFKNSLRWPFYFHVLSIYGSLSPSHPFNGGRDFYEKKKLSNSKKAVESTTVDTVDEEKSTAKFRLHQLLF